tara:strand:- start:34455 stop:35162 length:708 start_codon:yes stop_codon:yes gene_type:complete
MQNNFKKILLFLVLVISSLIFYFTNKINKSRKIEKINISIKSDSNYFISKDSVKSILMDKVFIKKDSISTYSLEKLIDKNNYIEKSEVYKGIGNELNFIINQKQPIARIITDDSTFYLDNNSNFMTLSRLYSKNVPLIFGYNQYSDLIFLTKIFHIINDDKFLKKNVTKVFISDDNEISLKLRELKPIIEIGKNNRLNEKMKKLKALYIRSDVKNDINKYSSLNLRFKQQIIGVK